MKTYRLRAREGSLFSYYINLKYRENTEYSDGVILEVYNLKVIGCDVNVTSYWFQGSTLCRQLHIEVVPRFSFRPAHACLLILRGRHLSP
jgi:hypothetical protein